MMQFYCLSVMLNLLAGFTILFVAEKPTNLFVQDKIFKLVLGVLCAFVGFIKLLPFASGFTILGDFLPFIAGLLAGACLVLDYVQETMSELPYIVEVIFVAQKKLIGIFCIAVALLHFIIPQVLFF